MSMMRRLSTRITILLLTKWDDLGLTWIDVFGGYGMYMYRVEMHVCAVHVRLSARHHMSHVPVHMCSFRSPSKIRIHSLM